MKKTFKTAFILLLLAAASFGAGMFGAHMQVGGAFLNTASLSRTISDDVLTQISIEQPVHTSPEVEVAADTNNASPTNESDTPHDSTEKFSFAVFGDTQYFKPGSNGGFQKAARSAKDLHPDVVFALGDLVSSCDGGSKCEDKYNAWKNVVAPLSVSVYPTQGNHDRSGKDKADTAWEKSFSYLPTNGPDGFKRFAYSVDFKNSHFVVLDSEKPKEHVINDTQRNWLEQDLRNNNKENTFVFFHEPAYPVNSKINESLDVKTGDRDALWGILTRNNVEAVFVGHEHISNRRQIDGVYQFHFGNTDSFSHMQPKPGTSEYAYIGQAFGMVEVDGNKITVKTYSADGNLLNSFDFGS